MLAQTKKLKIFTKILKRLENRRCYIEVKYLIKLYSGEDIENIQEAVIIMDVLMHTNSEI